MLAEINQLSEMKDVANGVYLFIYKSGSAQSDCALENLRKAADEVRTVVYAADVTKTNTVHTALGVTSAPVFLRIVESKVEKVVKGCQSEGFYKTLLNGQSFTTMASSGAGGASVLMYTTPTCTYCNSLKSYLREHNVGFSEIDVSKDEEAARQMVARSGQQGVPQTLINGEVVIGFDRMKINQLLNIS